MTSAFEKFAAFRSVDATFRSLAAHDDVHTKRMCGARCKHLPSMLQVSEHGVISVLRFVRNERALIETNIDLLIAGPTTQPHHLADQYQQLIAANEIEQKLVLILRDKGWTTFLTPPAVYFMSDADTYCKLSILI